MRIPILALLIASGTLDGAETLSNGIVLPDRWPPHPDELRRTPPEVPPYLRQPPRLIPIDTGLLLGMFTIWRGHPADELRRPKINELCVGFSRDGFHWSRPERSSFCPVSEDPAAWNFGNLQSAGGCCLIVGDRLFFYVGATRAGTGADPNSTGLAILRRDGFTSMDAGAAGGSLTTRPVIFKGSHLFVNADAKQGTLRAEFLDEHGRVLAPYSLAECTPMRSDSTRHEIRWQGAPDLAPLAGRPVRLRFHLSQGSLYAFWVSRDGAGHSGGFTAAGGPGLSGPTDSSEEPPAKR